MSRASLLEHTTLSCWGTEYPCGNKNVLSNVTFSTMLFHSVKSRFLGKDCDFFRFWIHPLSLQPTSLITWISYNGLGQLSLMSIILSRGLQTFLLFYQFSGKKVLSLWPKSNKIFVCFFVKRIFLKLNLFFYFLHFISFCRWLDDSVDCVQD